MLQVEKCVILMGCSLYVLTKLLNIKLQKKIRFQIPFLFVIALPVIYVVSLYDMPFSQCCIVLFLVFFSVKFLELSFNISVTASAISFGISYVAYVIAVAISSVFLLFRLSFPEWISLLIIFIIEVLIISIVFKTKRLKNGMPFLIEHGAGDLGVYISITLVIAATFLGMDSSDNLLKLIPVIFVLLAGLVVIFWWRRSLTRKYIDQVKAQEILALQNTIAERDAEIERLKHQNDELSRIIHRDNKLIPALEYAVRQYLLTSDNESKNPDQVVKGISLLSQIDSASQERKGILSRYEVSNKELPSTNVASLDCLLLYMFLKAKEQLIDFDLSICASVKYMIENVAEESDINTLLADLIENAIIASQCCKPKKIMVNIGITDRHYAIDVFDSGDPFPPEVIENLGLKRITTHADEGGSGIGLFTAFSILKKYQASFELEIYPNDNCYRKKVTVCFDNLGQVRIKPQNGTADAYKPVSKYICG